MNKALLGFLALGLPIAAFAAGAERSVEHGQLAITRASFQSDLAWDRDERKASAGFAKSRRENFLASRTAEAGQHAARATPSAVAAPEIDPSSAITGLTLLLGGVAVLRGRKLRAP